MLFDDQFLSRLELLTVVARKAVSGVARAERRSKRIGQGIEFADHRDYNPGDDFRYIDWNIYGRLGRLLLKLFEEEEDLFVYLLVDLSDSMGHGDPPKRDHARRLAAALAYVALSGLDRVSLTVFSSGIIDRMPPTRGKGQIFKVFDFLESAATGGVTRLEGSLEAFVHQNKRRGVAVVLSDFYDPDGYRDALNYLRYNKFKTFVIHVCDDRELDFGLTGDLDLVDSETQARFRITVTPGLIERYRAAYLRFGRELEEFCKGIQVPYYRAPVQIPFDDLLLRVFRDGGLLR